MLKFLLIAALTLYILSKIGGFFFRAGASQQFRSQQPKPSQRKDFNSKKGSKSGNIKGGDYVDYEEVK